ncbi:head-tail adaptor protein [Sphingomonas immobilis]|uniref:Head-tail adaptor protein n=1 Tax=Sphingomonas immobilis TaxID=3063997 RepID=A0ABT9A0U4_9SPHN|nr:head-tail adaptor protein [Sphingomonas sp. CA1-15]MDO7843450.1 head-tail adaptor protein [Sphingomonas sp. CA1-15]
MSIGEGRSSRFRDRVTIQEANTIDNGRGGRKVPPGEDPWRDLATDVACEVLPLRGGEALSLGVQRATQLYRVTMRPRSLTPAHRLLWNGVPLNIRTAPPPQRGADLVMTCESGATG